MVGKSWSYASDRRVIELAKASKSLKEVARTKRTPAHSQSCDAAWRFIQSREEEINCHSTAATLSGQATLQRGRQPRRPPTCFLLS
jgi:hypothetical protein